VAVTDTIFVLYQGSIEPSNFKNEKINRPITTYKGDDMNGCTHARSSCKVTM